MLCKYNGTGPWGVGTGVVDGSVVIFSPGTNTIKDEDYELIKNHPEVKKRIESKALELIVESLASAKPSSSDAPPTELGALNANDAKKLIAETHNTVELNKWKEEETRAGVIKAIDAQLALIDKDREADAAAAKLKKESEGSAEQ